MSTVIVLFCKFIVIIGMKSTTIAISDITHDALTTIGKKGQSFDDILKQLISKWYEKS